MAKKKKNKKAKWSKKVLDTYAEIRERERKRIYGFK